MCVAVHNMSSMDEFFLANHIILNEGSCSYTVILLCFSSGVINIWTTTKDEIYLVDPHHIV